MSTDCGYSFNSSCIDAGDPTYEDSLLHCNLDLGLQRSDIGAYGGVVKIVGVEDEISLPTEYILTQNYPNPFNPSTTISFQLPTRSMVTLKVFDILGREVKTLINEERDAGKFNINFNASSISSGV
jgi:hypothetical protein